MAALTYKISTDDPMGEDEIEKMDAGIKAVLNATFAGREFEITITESGKEDFIAKGGDPLFKK